MQEDINIQELQQAVEFNLTRDGFLVPVVFICGTEGAQILDATEYMLEKLSLNDIILSLRYSRRKI